VGATEALEITSRNQQLGIPLSIDYVKNGNSYSQISQSDTSERLNDQPDNVHIKVAESKTTARWFFHKTHIRQRTIESPRIIWLECQLPQRFEHNISTLIVRMTVGAAAIGKIEEGLSSVAMTQ
jgi:hypothetical protein